MSAAALPADADAGHGEACVLATLRACGWLLGIDRRHIVQAIAVPPDMAPVPRRAGGVAGVVAHGAQLVPVVDLKRWAQPDDPDAESPAGHDARIVILAHDGQVLGLRVDALIGLRQCPAQAVRSLFHDDAPDELFVQAALLDPAEPPLVLLDPARLAALTRSWCEQAGLDTAAAAAAPIAAPAAAAAPLASFGSFRVGDAVIGIPPEHIAELQQVPALRPAPLPRPATRGLCDWRGHVLPVIDLTAPLGAAADPQPPAWMCVVRDGERRLGLLVHEIFGMTRAALPAPGADDGLRGDRADFVAAELPVEQGIVQVLDPQRLMAHFSESALSVRRGAASASASATATATATAADAGRSRKPYMVFEAPGALACELDGVQEVLPLPDAVREHLAAGLPARLTWRGHAVPVRDVLSPPGAGPVADWARQLIVLTQGEQRLAVPIVAVKAMIPAHTGTLSRIAVGGRGMAVVSTQTSEQAASYAVVDLLAHLQGAAAG